MTGIRKVVLTPEVEADLLVMSARWEQEDSCFGYRTNTREDLEGQEIFFAQEEGRTVGYLLCHPYIQERDSCTVPAGSRCLEIEELFVLPECRSRGVGKALYRFAADSYAEVEYVTLSTATKNYKSILHFYVEELGMTFWSARLFQKRNGS